jgi:hypothetical protein
MWIPCSTTCDLVSLTPHHTLNDRQRRRAVGCASLHRRHSGCLPMSCPATSILGVHGMVGTAICVQQWTSSHRAVLTCSNSTSSLHCCRCCAIWALMRACPCWVAASRALQHRASIHVQ